MSSACSSSSILAYQGSYIRDELGPCIVGESHTILPSSAFVLNLI